MLHSVNRADYLDRLRITRRRLVERCASIEIAQRAEQLLLKLERTISRPVRVVLLGEVNGGKTTLSNHILDCDLLKADVIHNTQVPILLKFAATAQVELCRADGSRCQIDQSAIGRVRVEHDDKLEVGVPLDILSEIEIVDTPGATLDEVALARLRAVYAQADLAIWCTVATQAWRGTEVALWNALDRRKPRADILAVTHADLLSPENRARVLERVNNEAQSQFGAIVAVGHEDEAGAAPSELISALRAAVASSHAERCRRSGKIIAKFASRLERKGAFDALDGSVPAPVLHAANLQQSMASSA